MSSRRNSNSSSSSNKRVDFSGQVRVHSVADNNEQDYDETTVEDVESPPPAAATATAAAATASPIGNKENKNVASSRRNKGGDGGDGVARVNLISDLDVYDGETLEEKVDSFLSAHPVVMINRTWCLFSDDAKNFLVHQLGVSVHSIEIDIHPRGKEILNHVTKRTGHKTTPIIFVKGEFLGGFEEVNSLYAQGKLEEEYLKDLSHADRCEAILSSQSIKTKPMFWFPERVDGNVVRITAVLTAFCSATSAVLALWMNNNHDLGHYLAYGLLVDFCLRLLGGAKISIIGRIAMVVAGPLDPNPRVGRPKQFATCCGLLFSFLASLFFLLNSQLIVVVDPTSTAAGATSGAQEGEEELTTAISSSSSHYTNIIGSVFIGMLGLCSFMEGFLDFCLGCFIFQIGIKTGLFSKN